MARPPLSILVVNPVMPRPDRDSGSLRLYRLLKLLRGQGHRVTLLTRLGLGEEETALDLERDGIEVHRVDRDRLAERGFDLDVPPLDLPGLLTEGRFDVAILSTWEAASQYLPLVRRVSPLTRLVVDTVDVHWLREQRGAELAGDPAQLRRAQETRAGESAVYRQADALIAVTEPDADALREMAPGVPVHVVSNVHDPDPRGPGFGQRDGVVFVGSFNHPPNVDAATHLVRDVWPLVRRSLPAARLSVVGTAPPPEVVALAGDGVEVTGWVPEVRPYLDAARVSVAPLRFGAGVKGKIGEALGAGLPVVTTAIGAEGMSLADGETALVADSAEELAAAIVRLHETETLWESIAEAGHRHVGVILGSGVARAALDAMLAAVAPISFLAPRGLDAQAAQDLLAGYFAAFGETDPVSLVVPVADAAAGEAILGVLVEAIGALGRDPEHIPDLAVTPVPATAPVPSAMAPAPSGGVGAGDAAEAVAATWRTAHDVTDHDTVPAPRATLVVRPGDDVAAAEAQLHALAAAELGDDVELIVVAGAALDPLLARIDGVEVLRFPSCLGRRAAIQRAAVRARGEVVVVLDTLVHPEPDFLAPLVAAVEGGAVLAAPVIDGAHGYRVEPDGSLFPRTADAPGAPAALALDCLAARRELWLAMPARLPAREGHAETQLAAWAQDHGPLAIAPGSVAHRQSGDPASILICTRNRGDELPDGIELLVASGADDVLIVDNGSTDGSDAVAQEIAARHPGVVRVVSEPRGGLSHARNTAAEHARHDILLYLDDDARPGPGWLERMTWALSQPGVVQAGGPIVALWPATRDPEWPAPGREGLLSILDLGDADTAFGGTSHAYGANWGVRREALRAAGGFDATFGWGPANHIGGEEVHVASRIERLGLGAMRYVALAGAGHRIARSRMSDDFLVDRVMRAGIENPRLAVALDPAARDALTAAAERAANGLMQRCPLHGDLTLEHALAAIQADERPIDPRLDAAYALGVIAGCVLLLGEHEVEVGPLRLRFRDEHLAGLLSPLATLETV